MSFWFMFHHEQRGSIVFVYASLVISHIPRLASLKADVLHFHVDSDGNGISQKEPPWEVDFFFFAVVVLKHTKNTKNN